MNPIMSRLGPVLMVSFSSSGSNRLVGLVIERTSLRFPTKKFASKLVEFLPSHPLPGLVLTENSTYEQNSEKLRMLKTVTSKFLIEV